MRALIAVAGLAFAAPLSAQQTALAPTETLLEVAAEGRAFATPDRATLYGGVTTNDPTTRGAVAANSIAIASVITALRQAGVPNEDIRTSRVSLQPQYETDERGRRLATITSYTAVNSVTITVRDLRRTSDYLTALFDSGATDISGPNFRVDDDASLVLAARNDAIARARQQADTYAAAFGMRVARVIRISERGRRQAPDGDHIQGFVDRERIQNTPITSVLIGQIEQTASLWVDFALVSR